MNEPRHTFSDVEWGAVARCSISYGQQNYSIWYPQTTETYRNTLQHVATHVVRGRSELLRNTHKTAKETHKRAKKTHKRAQATHYCTLVVARCSIFYGRKNDSNWYPQTTETYCNTLQYIATHCTTPQHTTTHNNALKRISEPDILRHLQHTATLYNTLHHTTGWRRLIDCLKLQVIFRKRATNYMALLQKMTYEDKASYDSTPPCTSHHNTLQHTQKNDSTWYPQTLATHCNTLYHTSLQHTATHCNTLQRTQ